jgi:hypothetical protein
MNPSLVQAGSRGYLQKGEKIAKPKAGPMAFEQYQEFLEVPGEVAGV